MSVEPAPLTRRPVGRDLALLSLVVLVAAVPFLGQPFHMDDAFYMDMARNALEKPLYPNDTPYIFEGRRLPDMGSHSHPPFQTYFLAAIMRVAGEGAGKEWIYHACALVYPLLAVASMYFLSARLVARPLLPAMALGFSPVFMVMQHNLMTDLPTLSFWLAGVASFVWATELGRKRIYLASSLFQFLAIFTSYHSVVLTPLLGFYQLRRRGKSFGWAALTAPVALLAGWFALNYAHYGRFLLSDTAGYMVSRVSLGAGTILTKFLATLVYQGWLVVFPFFLLYVLGLGLRGRVLGLTALGSLYVACTITPAYRPVDRATLVVGLTAGAFVLGALASLTARSFRRRAVRLPFDAPDAQFLGLWYFAGLATCLLVFTEGSARYILPLVPPVLIAFFRRLEITEIMEYRSKARPVMRAAAAASGNLVFTLAFGLVLGHADLDFARFYPRMAEDFKGIAGALPRFYGGEWGFRYYLSRAGIEQLPMDENSVRGSSMIALPRLALPYELPAALQGMAVPVKALSYPSRTPVVLMGREVPAGFYSTGWGLVPFSFSWKAPERMTVSQIDYFVAELPTAEMSGESRQRPWPGYVTLAGETLLGLLVHPGTTVRYPWTIDVPSLLRIRCGLSPDASRTEAEPSLEFQVVQRDSHGDVLASSRARQAAGWQWVEVELKPRTAGGRSLELSLAPDVGAGRVVGAFATPIIQPR